MHVQKRWRSLANRLSMTKEANAIQREANIYMHSPAEIVVNLLEQVKDVKGKSSTCGFLYDALRAENFNEVCGKGVPSSLNPAFPILILIWSVSNQNRYFERLV